jgi:hypothetical protein
MPEFTTGYHRKEKQMPTKTNKRAGSVSDSLVDDLRKALKGRSDFNVLSVADARPDEPALCCGREGTVAIVRIDKSPAK